MKTKLKDHTRAVIVAIFALTFLGIGCIAAGQQGEEKRGKKQISEDKTLVKESTREGGYQYYFIPLIPIIVVLFGTAGGAFLSYYYWKKKEEYSRKNAIH